MIANPPITGRSGAGLTKRVIRSLMRWVRQRVGRGDQPEQHSGGGDAGHQPGVDVDRELIEHLVFVSQRTHHGIADERGGQRGNDRVGSHPPNGLDLQGEHRPGERHPEHRPEPCRQSR